MRKVMNARGVAAAVLTAAALALGGIALTGQSGPWALLLGFACGGLIGAVVALTGAILPAFLCYVVVMVIADVTIQTPVAAFVMVGAVMGAAVFMVQPLVTYWREGRR